MMLMREPDSTKRSDKDLPRVAVVMATYNGQTFLAEQVESIYQQIGVYTTLFVYDDCSTDSTPHLLNHLASKYRTQGWHMHVTFGAQNVGFPTSFFTALASAPNSFDYYAYADQDDVWKNDKLLTAVNALREVNTNAYSSNTHLYFEPTTAVDEHLEYLFERKLNKLNLTVQSFFVRARVAAHTMVFNTVLKREIEAMGQCHCGFSHGWLALLIVTCSKGEMLVGNSSHTLHRRLDSSVSAGGQGIMKRISFEWNVIFHPEVCRTPMAMQLLKRYGKELTPSETVFLRELSQYKRSIRDKIRLLSSKSFESDVPACSIEAWISCLFNRY